MSVYQLKSRFQHILRPLVDRLAALGVTANQVTLAAAGGSVLLGVGLIVAQSPTWFALVPLWFFLRMALNAIDGMLAREHGQKSLLGAYLNEIADVVSDAALYAPFAFVAPFNPEWIAAIVFLATLTEFAGVTGAANGRTRRYDGPMGKSDRAVVFGVLGAWVALGHGLPEWVVFLQPALCVLLALTVINRVRRGLAET